MTIFSKPACLAPAFVMLSCSPWAVAGDDAPLKPGQSEFNGAFVMTNQSTDRNGVRGEYLHSLDLLYTVQFDGFGVHGWAEYAKSTKAGGVADTFGEANADAGTLTVPDGQISELYLFGNVDDGGEPGWRIGLNEVTTLVDRSGIANDEVEQFLSLGLVNNLTIAFPDYALSGFIQDMDAFDEFGYRLVISSSHGWAESGTTSYSDLVNVTQPGEQLFSAFELVFSGIAYEANIGYWRNSGSEAGAGYGLYTGLDYFSDHGKFNLRYGTADALEGEAEQFASIAWQKALFEGQLSLGYTFTRYRGEPDRLVRQSELYYRKQMLDQVIFSPSLQWIDNSGFGDTDNENLLLTMRIEISF